MKNNLILVLIAMVIFTACNSSENEEGIGRLSVRLTDAPGEYETVMIDIEQLWVHVTSEDSSEWIELPLEIDEPLNLLDFTNDNDTLLTELDFPAGKISQMRMVLGNENEISIEGEESPFPLETPSALQSGLKFNIHADIQEGVTYRMWIDFDATRSIVKRGNGSYALKPTLKVFTEDTSGAIKGVVAPEDANEAKVYAISGANDTLASTITTDGEFLLKGLDQGSYKVSVVPVVPYLEKEMTEVEVTIGIITDLDTIFVSQ